MKVDKQNHFIQSVSEWFEFSKTYREEKTQSLSLFLSLLNRPFLSGKASMAIQKIHRRNYILILLFDHSYMCDALALHWQQQFQTERMLDCYQRLPSGRSYKDFLEFLEADIRHANSLWAFLSLIFVHFSFLSSVWRIGWCLVFWGSLKLVMASFVVGLQKFCML